VDDNTNVLIEFLEYEEGQLLLEDNFTAQMYGGSPGGNTPWRVEPFVYTEPRRIYQGRMFYSYGAHYWGSGTQGTLKEFDSGVPNCAQRYTNLVFTSFSDDLIQISVGIEAVVIQSLATLTTLGLSTLSLLLL